MEENRNSEKMFSKDFLWGASTASHQVEGRTENQWSVWELENANHLAKHPDKKLKKLSNWNEIKYKVENPANYVSGEGVDHYRRFKEDFDLAKSLNLTETQVILLIGLLLILSF